MASSSLVPIRSADWNDRLALHLLNRAGFGVPRPLLEQLTQSSPADAVRSLVYFTPDLDEPQPDFIISPLNEVEVATLLGQLSDEQRRKATTEGQAIEYESVNMLKAWWLARMIESKSPLQEKLALFWHGHFATSAQKVRQSWPNNHILQVFRRHGAGNIKSLTRRVGQAPAMLGYLDNYVNVKGQPNENWARELLELFTLGHGNYSENDIKELARAFTGWSVDLKEFVYRDEFHDDGIKTILGRTGNFDGWEAIEVIFAQDAAARHFATKLWAFFVYEQPEDEIVEGLAQTLREHDYDVRPCLERMFLSEAFFSERAVAAQVKSPVQLIVQMCHHLELNPPPYNVMIEAAAALGQDLFFPPDVGGWAGGKGWINAHTIFNRYNLPIALVNANAATRDEMAKRMDNEMIPGGMTNVPKGVDHSGAIGRFFEALPEKLRKPVAKQTGIAREDYRAWYRTWVEALAERSPWHSQTVFKDLTFTTADGCVDMLERRYMAVPLSQEQRAILLEALGAAANPGMILTANSIPEPRMNQTLHLLFSMAEYQVC